MTAEPRWRRLGPDERRQQLLACAVRLFGERPYDEVSASDIAREAGVARGLINHYFGTKKDLFCEVVRVMLTIPEDAVLQLPRGDLTTRVEAAVTWFLDTVSKHAKPWLVVIGATAPTGDPDVARILAEADEETAHRILQVARPQGPRPDEQHLRAAMRAYVGFARTTAVEWLDRGSLTRAQAHVLLSHTLVTLLEHTVPAMRRQVRPQA